MSLADFQQQVDDLVRDKDQVVSSVQRDLAIGAAAVRYSLDFPRVVVVDQSAPGGVGLELPAGWQMDYSQALAFEYPIDQVPASDIPVGSVRLRQRPAGVAFELPASVEADELIRITYTQRHVVDLTIDTIPEQHRLPVACWAAALLCGQLAAYYATEGAPTIAADAADHQGKTERFRARMRDLTAQYFNDLGVTQKRPQVAGTVISVRGSDSRGQPRLFPRGRH